MTVLAPAPVAAGDRIVALDVVRGLAVLGILAMNIVEFGLPMHAYGNPREAGGSEGADLWAWFAQMTLFDGRMRALFSMLFGAGIVLIHQRMAAAGRPEAAADLLLRRCLWLIPFGIAHRFLLQWTGDILYMYGLFGVLAVAFRTARPRTLLLLGALALLAFVPIELRGYGAAAEQRSQAAEAVALADAGEDVPEELQRARERWERRAEAPEPGAHDDEIAAIRGSWLDVARHRWDHNHRFQHAYVYNYFVWDVFGMILLGMGLGGLGFFAGRMKASVYVATLVAGAVAAVGSFVLAKAWADGGWSRMALENTFWRGVLYPFLRLAVGLAWAAALILILRAGVLRLVTTPLAAVGRMAFSNYILQTVLGTLFFFGYGLGYYDHLSRSELMLVLAAFSAVQVVFSLLWLRAFRFGPLEWCWRALTYRERPPFRR